MAKRRNKKKQDEQDLKSLYDQLPPSDDLDNRLAKAYALIAEASGDPELIKLFVQRDSLEEYQDELRFKQLIADGDRLTKDVDNFLQNHARLSQIPLAVFTLPDDILITLVENGVTNVFHVWCYFNKNEKQAEFRSKFGEKAFQLLLSQMLKHEFIKGEFRGKDWFWDR